ncbi:MAG: hypothetical protein A2Z37_08215 [Chloroflexi bacterium RBG_19FT_COMBO_62_14]|nr:MAG: hypothetical protein A2Z37_08215 [Chloroflexi bacterium RBG_19FT_COMBO_62_14]
MDSLEEDSSQTEIRRKDSTIATRASSNMVASVRLAPGMALVFLVGLFLVFRFLPLPAREPTIGPEPIGGSEAIRVYFTQPASTGSSEQVGSVEEELVKAIDEAQSSVDMAVYALNLGDIADALRRANQRGVDVRLVIESDNADEPEVQALMGAGIPIHADQRPPLMHHKFMVIDGAELWTGSMNMTSGAAFQDNNNLVRIASARLADDFTGEFNEMFEQDRFGALSLEDTPYASLEVSGVTLEVLFSPDDGVAARIIDLIDGAEFSLDFAAFSLTSNAIADRLIAAAERGVRVRGVMETSQVGGTGSEYARLRQARLDVRLDENPFNMHHKFIVIDSAVVATGSYNFSASAEERNDENMLLIHDPRIASLYLEEFSWLFEAAGPSP